MNNKIDQKIVLIVAGVFLLLEVIQKVLNSSYYYWSTRLRYENGWESVFSTYWLLAVGIGCICLIIFCGDKVLRNILLAIAIYYVFVYLIIAFFRVKYPFELEWCEGGEVDQVIRILSGQQLYVKPSLAFIPYVYTPFYLFISAVLSKIFGIGFFPLRFISFISSLGCFYVVFLIVKRETESYFWGVLSACLLAATFRISGAWFDLARVDSLFLFFLLLAIYVFRFYSSPWSNVLAGLLISLSFYTKQTALIPGIFMMAGVFILNRKNAHYFIGTMIVLIGGGVLFLNYTSKGYFFYYLFNLPMHIGVHKEELLKFWVDNIFSPLPIVTGVGAFYIVYLLLRKNSSIYPYVFISIGMLVSSWSQKVHYGGYDNDLFPAYAIMAILFGLGAGELIKIIDISFSVL